MSILINMEMPEKQTIFTIFPNGYVAIYDAKESFIGETNAFPIPPHGDLIDRDALTDAIDNTDWYHQAPNKDMVDGANSAEHQAWFKAQDVYFAVDNVPIIIPSDKEDE